MNVEIIVRVDGQEVAQLQDDLPTAEALPWEERVERLKARVGCVVLEIGCRQLAAELRQPCCCGRKMENRGQRRVTLHSQSGEFTFRSRSQAPAWERTRREAPLRNG